LPFKMENGKLFADKEYTDPDLRFISCLPNPQNPANAILVYTAFTNNKIVDINNVFHGPEDYVVFVKRDDIIKKGFYKKEGDWKY